jgi:hypothetical protein
MAKRILPRIDLAGQRFGRWLVLGPEVIRDRRMTKILCGCSCGTIDWVHLRNLRNGRSASCGCTLFRHGLTNTLAERCWRSMLTRCYNPANKSFHRYGGRGITVCARWRGSLAAYYADMGDPPSPDHSIDRIDNDGGYWCGKAECPDCGPAGRTPNCRWATPKEQARNSQSARMITFQGRTLCMTDWSGELGFPLGLVGRRISQGWSVEKALTTPYQPCRRK